MTSAKTAGIVLGVVVPLILLVWCLVTYCRRVAKDSEDDQSYYFSDKKNKQDAPRVKIGSPKTSKISPLISTKSDPEKNPPLKEQIPLETKSSPSSSKLQPSITPVILSESPKSPRYVTNGSGKRSEDSFSSSSSAMDVEVPRSANPPASQGPTGLNFNGTKLPTRYDGVYYTGEPLPGRPEILEFNDEKIDPSEFPPPPPPPDDTPEPYVSSTIKV